MCHTVAFYLCFARCPMKNCYFHSCKVSSDTDEDRRETRQPQARKQHKQRVFFFRMHPSSKNTKQRLCSHWFGVIIFINNTTVATTNSIQFNSIQLIIRLNNWSWSTVYFPSFDSFCFLSEQRLINAANSSIYFEFHSMLNSSAYKYQWASAILIIRRPPMRRTCLVSFQKTDRTDDLLHWKFWLVNFDLR